MEAEPSVRSEPSMTVQARRAPLCVLPTIVTSVSDPSPATTAAGSKRMRATAATSGRRSIAALTLDARGMGARASDRPSELRTRMS